MTKHDPRKEEPHLYKAPRDHAVLVDVPDEAFLAIDGKGSPRDPAFHEAIGALYAVAYGIKFLLKEEAPDEDHAVMPLEALWWWKDGAGFPVDDEKAWHWRLMIRQPDGVRAEHVERALARARERRPVPGLDAIRLVHHHEGKALQILHVGPYKDEARTIARLHEEVKEAGYEPAGKHHEIYLGDPRRAKPQNLRTLLRQPVRPRQAGA